MQLLYLIFYRIVSTDALARGIDIPGVNCVVSYDAPKVDKLYIHRTGRTGRAGHKGTAITLLGTREQGPFEHMLRSAGKLDAVKVLDSPLEEMEALEENYKLSLAAIKKKILVSEEFKNKMLYIKKRIRSFY